MARDRIRICFFIPDLSDGGAQRQCAAISNEMARRPDVDFNLILLGEGSNIEDLDVPSSRIHLRNFRNFSDPRAFVYVAETLTRLRPHVLVSWLHPADIISSVASRLTRTKWIIAERDSEYPARFVYRARRMVGVASDGVIANSQKGADYWSTRKPKKSATIIPNVVLQPRIEAEWRLDATQILCIGRLEAQKNVSQVLSVFASALPQMPGAKLAVIGKGSLRDSLESEVSDLRIENVKFHGFRRDVDTEYPASRLMISASRHEGMPNVLLESIAAGITPVVSRIPEHTAILGIDYPYYIELDRDAAFNSHVLAAAWNDSDPQPKLAYGRALIDDLTVEKVTSMYIHQIRDFLASGV